MSPLSKKVIGLIVGGASAAVIGSQFLDEREGNSLTSYKDGGGVWTVCRGVTGKGIGPDTKKTDAECDELNRDAWDTAAAQLSRLAPNANLTEAQRAGIVSFCTYNLGAGKCKSSTFLKMLNAKDPGACKQILRWIYDGGKDCRTDKSCRGQVDRREQEYELCTYN